MRNKGSKTEGRVSKKAGYNPPPKKEKPPPPPPSPPKGKQQGKEK